MAICTSCQERDAQKQGQCLRCYMRDYRARKQGGTTTIEAQEAHTNGHAGDRAEIAALISTAIFAAMASVPSDPSEGLIEEISLLREELELLKSQGPRVTELHVTTDKGTHKLE